MAGAEIVSIITEKDVDDRRFHRVSSIAKLFAISESEVYRAIYAGELVARRYRSKVWLITIEDAEAWIAANTELNVA